MSDKHIKQLYKEVCNQLEGNYKIILEPGRNLTEEWIEYDCVKWEIEEQMIKLVEKLKRNEKSSFEDKVIEIYKFICLNYIYDDNVLFFFRKDISDPENVKYIAVDWYGRIIGKEWIENRKKHNRRICYEFSRFYAKAINDLLDNTEEMEAVIVGDKEMATFLHVIKVIVIVIAALFALTFTVYIFNLDMKLTAAIYPWLNKQYDKVKRDQHL